MGDQWVTTSQQCALVASKANGTLARVKKHGQQGVLCHLLRGACLTRCPEVPSKPSSSVNVISTLHTAPSPYQCVPLHVLPTRELLPADLTGVRPLSRVGPHVSLQNALMHGREAAVWALEFLPDHCELVDCKRASETSRLLSKCPLVVGALVQRFLLDQITAKSHSHPFTTCNFLNPCPYTISLISTVAESFAFIRAALERGRTQTRAAQHTLPNAG